MNYENPYKNLKREIPYKSQTLTYEEANALVKNKYILLSGNSVLTPKEISWEHAREVYNSYSTQERADIRKSGQQNLQGYYNPNTKKLDPPGTPPTEARGIMIVQMYLQQAARCAYTGLGSNHILDFQVEHIDPNGGDYPENIVLVRANVNENRKDSTMEHFIASHENRLKKLRDKESYDIWYNETVEANKKNKKEKAKILDMFDKKLAAAWKKGIISKANEKYIWRNIGMSSLSKFRVHKKTGVRRSGGTQGNYKEILNTVAKEYLYEDKELSRRIYDMCRDYRNNYLNQSMTLHEYAKKTVDAVSQSKFFDSDKQKLLDTIIRNNYNYHDI